jgi:hypothetical protein
MGGPDILHAVNRAIDLKKRSLSGRFVSRYCVPSSSGGLAAAASLHSKYAMQTDAVAKTRADALPEGIIPTCRTEFEVGGMVTSNYEVERRWVASTPDQADLSKSSTPSLAHRRRGLEPLVRRDWEQIIHVMEPQSPHLERQAPRMAALRDWAHTANR